MSIIICRHCGQRVDTDYNVEYEEECEEYSIEKIPQFKGTLKQLNKLTIIKK